MLGLSYYQTKVYSKAAETLGKVTTDNDALTQNAYLHMGLSYLQLAEKNKARQCPAGICIQQVQIWKSRSGCGL